MLPHLSSRAQKACARPTRLHRWSLLGILLTTGLLAACGSPSMSDNTQAPASVLNISAALPQGAVGASYKAALTVTGGTSPYTFSVASGQLPTGVQLAKSSGTFSGTPTASGNFSFAVSVSDSSGQAQQKSLQIAVSNDSSGSSSGPTSGSSGGNTGASNAPAEPSFSILL